MSQPPEPERWNAKPDGPQDSWGPPPTGPETPPGYWPAVPAAGPRFNPADPLVSNDYAGWWQRGVTVVKAGWRPLALLQLITCLPFLALLVPAQVSGALAQRDLAREMAGGGTPQFGDYLLNTTTAAVAVAALVAAVIYLIGELATMRMVVTVATGGEARVGQALRGALPRVPALLGWYVIAGLVMVVALCACFLPLLYVGAVFTILPAVVLFERGGVIGRCFRLFNTDLGSSVSRVATLFGLGIAIALPFAGLSFIVTLATGGTGFPDPATVSTGAV